MKLLPLKLDKHAIWVILRNLHYILNTNGLTVKLTFGTLDDGLLGYIQTGNDETRSLLSLLNGVNIIRENYMFSNLHFAV